MGGSVFVGGLILTTALHTPIRLINLNFNMILTIPLVGFLLFTKIRDGKLNSARMIAILVLVSIVFASLSIYQDPVQMTPNGTVTSTEASGANWYIAERDDGIEYFGLQTIPWRFADMVYGHEYVLEHQSLLILNDPGNHFSTITSSNESIGDSYLAVSTYDKMAYTTVWAASDRFNANDFQGLAYSDKVMKNFDNGGFQCYLRA